MLLEKKFVLLKNDVRNNIYIFENKPSERFALDNVTYVVSDTLTF